MTLIETTDELAALCRRLAAHPFVTVDTEFLRETTFWPKLCVLQLASDDEAAVVDALSPELDLGPFLELMRNSAVVKVFHAARQDLEIVWKLAGFLPVPLFDTQVAAMVCGFGDQVSYGELVQALCRIPIDKSSRFTDWARRPLSEAQIAYALADVTHLGTYIASCPHNWRNPDDWPGWPTRCARSPRWRPTSSIPTTPGSASGPRPGGRAISRC